MAVTLDQSWGHEVTRLIQGRTTSCRIGRMIWVNHLPWMTLLRCLAQFRPKIMELVQ